MTYLRKLIFAIISLLASGSYGDAYNYAQCGSVLSRRVLNSDVDKLNIPIALRLTDWQKRSLEVRNGETKAAEIKGQFEKTVAFKNVEVIDKRGNASRIQITLVASINGLNEPIVVKRLSRGDIRAVSGKENLRLNNRIALDYLGTLVFEQILLLNGIK